MPHTIDPAVHPVEARLVELMDHETDEAAESLWSLLSTSLVDLFFVGTFLSLFFVLAYLAYVSVRCCGAQMNASRRWTILIATYCWIFFVLGGVYVALRSIGWDPLPIALAAGAPAAAIAWWCGPVCTNLGASLAIRHMGEYDYESRRILVSLPAERVQGQLTHVGLMEVVILNNRSASAAATGAKQQLETRIPASTFLQQVKVMPVQKAPEAYVKQEAEQQDAGSEGGPGGGTGPASLESGFVLRPQRTARTT